MTACQFQGSAAQVFVNAVGDGQHRPACAGPAQSLQHPGFGFCVQVGGDLIQQQHGRVRRRGTGNGQ